MKLPDEIRELFRKQGKIGARRRSQLIPAERRHEIAKQAAEARWHKNKPKRKRG